MVKKKRVPIVFEDDAVIVCEKPAGMPVQSDHTRDMDVLTILKHKTEVVKAGTPGARKAELDYELIDCIETKEGVLTWILVILHTGRHHQIRVQFASRGLGLYGDTKYNPKFQKTKKKYTEIGLYSTRISFVTGERMTFKIEPSGEAFEKMDVEAF